MAQESDDGAIRQSMARGSAWMVACRWLMRLLGVGSTLVLARLLDPGDFGIIAMAMIVVGFLEVFAQSGVDLALIRKEDSDRDDYNAAWTLQLLISLALGVIIFASAPLAATVFDEPRLHTVIQALAVRSWIMGLENIGVVDFRRTLSFRREFQFLFTKKVLSVAVVVSAAIIIGSYWALVIGMIAAQAAQVGLSYIMHPFRPRLSFARIPNMLSFSGWLVFYRIGRFLNWKIDHFIVGGIAGTNFMGQYHVASELATAPTHELVTPMNRGLYPVYAKLQGDLDGLVRHYLTVLSSVALICVPIGFGLAVVAEDAVRVLLGPAWRDAADLIRMFAVFGVLFAILNTTEILLTVIGRVRLLSLICWAQIIALAVTAYVVATQWSPVDIPAARCLLTALALPIVFALLRRVLPIGPKLVFITVWPRFLAGFGMVAAVTAVHELAPDMVHVRLVLDIGVGALAYVGLTVLLWLLRGRPSDLEQVVFDRLALRANRMVGRA